MKRAIRAFALLVALTFVASPAFAVTGNGVANVNIVEGITVTETTPLDFGDIALNDGAITVDADGTVTDDNFLDFGGTQQQAEFAVVSVASAALTVTVLDNVANAGLTINSPRVDWNGTGAADSPQNVTSIGNDTLEVGYTLTVDKAAAGTGAQTLNYTVDVTFQ